MYFKPRVTFVSFFLYIVYCAIVLGVWFIVHILCFVKQYDVNRHFFINEQFVNKNNTEKD